MEVGIGAMIILGAAQLDASNTQKKLDFASVDFNESQTQLQLAQQGYQNAVSFRQNLASQVALASVRGGSGGSMLRQFGSASFANFVQDQASIARSSKNVKAAAGMQKSQAAVGRYSRDLGIIASTGTNLFNVVNLNN